MSESYNICLDVGGTKVLGVIFNEKREIIYRLKKRSKSNGDSSANVEDVIVSVVEEMIQESGIKRNRINAIASCAPGVIDQDKGIVLFTPNLPWRNYDMKSSMEKKFGVPFYVGNDVNLGVLGEYKYGAGKGYKNIVGFFVGTGMGGGLILNGKLFTGNEFKAAEYGHMILDPEGPLCGCGQRGCLEAFSSKKGMTAYIRQQVGRGRKSMMEDQLVNEVFKSKSLKKALEAEDAVAMEAVDRACHYLAVGTGNLINTISPDLVVYGGGVIEAVGQIFLDKILAEVDRYCMPSIRSTVDLKIAELGDDSNLYGALAMIEGDKKKAK
jgi:glucokinase